MHPLLATKGAKAAIAIARAVLPWVLLVAAIVVCVVGLIRWDASRLEAAHAAGAESARLACEDEKAKAERDARRKLAEAERAAIEAQAAASADYERRIDELLTANQSLRARHARLARQAPSHPDCRVPADRVRIVREAIAGAVGR